MIPFIDQGLNRCYRVKNKSGEEKTFLIRLSEPGDEKGMIECIRDEYGDTYFKRSFYNEGFLAEKAKKKEIIFLVAEVIDTALRTESPRTGEIAGMTILKDFYPEESMCEVASQIFKKKYRGYGLSMIFFEHSMYMVENTNRTSVICLPVMFHDITQRLMKRFGLVATGLIMNVFDVEGIIHSYDNGRNTKHSQGLQVKKISKTKVGTLYIPREHIKFCKKIYRSLGVKYKISRFSKYHRKTSFSEVTCAQDANQNSLEIRIISIGDDVLEQVDRVLKEYPLRGKQTANIFLNINDENAVWLYEQLKNRDWFFAGLRPLCGRNEFMILHNCGETKVYFEDYHMSEEFRKIVEYIQKHRG